MRARKISASDICWLWIDNCFAVTWPTLENLQIQHFFSEIRKKRKKNIIPPTDPWFYQKYEQESIMFHVCIKNKQTNKQTKTKTQKKHKRKRNRKLTYPVFFSS